MGVGESPVVWGFAPTGKDPDTVFPVPRPAPDFCKEGAGFLSKICEPGDSGLEIFLKHFGMEEKECCK